LGERNRRRGAWTARGEDRACAYRGPRVRERTAREGNLGGRSEGHAPTRVIERIPMTAGLGGSGNGRGRFSWSFGLRRAFPTALVLARGTKGGGSKSSPHAPVVEHGRGAAFPAEDGEGCSGSPKSASRPCTRAGRCRTCAGRCDRARTEEPRPAVGRSPDSNRRLPPRQHARLSPVRLEETRGRDAVLQGSKARRPARPGGRRSRDSRATRGAVRAKVRADVPAPRPATGGARPPGRGRARRSRGNERTAGGNTHPLGDDRPRQGADEAEDQRGTATALVPFFIGISGAHAHGETRALHGRFGGGSSPKFPRASSDRALELRTRGARLHEKVGGASGSTSDVGRPPPTFSTV